MMCRLVTYIDPSLRSLAWRGGIFGPVVFVVFRDRKDWWRQWRRQEWRGAHPASRNPSRGPVQGGVPVPHLLEILYLLLRKARRWSTCSLPTYFIPKSSTHKVKLVGRHPCVHNPGVTWICLYPYFFSRFWVVVGIICLRQESCTFHGKFVCKRSHIWLLFLSDYIGESSRLGVHLAWASCICSKALVCCSRSP